MARQSIKTLVLGTRGSPLALWQANYIQQQLQPLISAKKINTQIQVIQTHGDKGVVGEVAGAFTKAIDEAVLNGSVTLGIHSAKDAPSTLADGLEVIAYTKRSAPQDVLVAYKPLPNTYRTGTYRIGTSSARRQAQVREYLPNCSIIPIQGNLGTRIQRLREGRCDALLLAYAGIQRLGHEALVQKHLPTTTFTPAVGQGCLMVVGLRSMELSLKQQLRNALQHIPTACCLVVERAFLRDMGMGCGSPVFGFAQMNNNLLSLQTGLYHLGQRIEYVEKLPIGTGVGKIETGGAERTDATIDTATDTGGAERIDAEIDETTDTGGAERIDATIDTATDTGGAERIDATIDTATDTGGAERIDATIDTATDTETDKTTDATIEGLTETTHTQLQQLGERAALYIQKQLS